MREDGTSRIFQFHKGTIKPQEKQNKEENQRNFNSIKVRLNRFFY